MSRSKDIRAEVQGMVDILYELHDATDPQKGEASEGRKLERAEQAISLWWSIYGRLMQWAQSQIIGYEMARSNPACREVLLTRRGKELSDDSHEYELLGSLYADYERASSAGTAWLHPDGGLYELAEQLEENKSGLDEETLRRVIVRLLWSFSVDSLVWRDPLVHALRALDYGEVDDFFKPSRRRRRGKSYQRDCARADAVKYVHYLVGRNERKYRAQERVGKAIGASVETLRTWEKELNKDDLFRLMWKTAEAAGQIEEGRGDLIEELPFRSYDGKKTDIEMAVYVLHELRGECSLTRIRERLRESGKQ